MKQQFRKVFFILSLTMIAFFFNSSLVSADCDDVYCMTPVNGDFSAAGCPAGRPNFEGTCQFERFFMTVDGICCSDIPPATPTPTIDIGAGTNLPAVNSATLDALNPFEIGESEKKDRLSTPGGIISELLSYAFPIAGFILFLMLVFGGFKMLTGATNSKSIEEGKQMITSAIFGFILLFASYWIIQLIQLIFNINILF